MKFKNAIKSLLISSLIFSGMSLISSKAKANARHIHPYHARTHRSYHLRRPRYRYAGHHIHHRKVRIHRAKKHRSVNRRKIQHGQVQRFSKKQVPKYTTVNNHTRDLRNAHWESFGHGRSETVKSYSGPRVKFKTLRFLPLHVGGTHFVQSIAVTPNGHWAFVGCDAFPYLSGYTKIARVNLRKKRGGIKVGPRFYGGHGQALAYNPRNGQLWLLVDPSGPMTHGRFDQISTNSLKPIHHVKFNLHNKSLGDTLTFDKNGNAYNENRIWQWDTTKQFKQGNILLYKGLINRHNAKFNLIKQGIRKAPGYIIQGIASNPQTKRLYIETDDAIMSIPSNRIGKLKPQNVKETILHGHREYEGISFDQKGHAYIVMARPNEILKSTRVY